MKREVTVPIGVIAKRLDIFLASELNVSRSEIGKWFKDDRIRLDQVLIRANYRPYPGDLITISYPILDTAQRTVPDLKVIYEDAEMVVIDKPAGIIVHSGNARSTESTIVDFARTITTDDDPDRPGIVHRLDRETSGLLVVAKSADSKQTLQNQWRDKQVKKTYQLLTIGRVDPEEAIIDLPLDRDPARPTRRRVVTTGRPALTRYKTLAYYPSYSLIEAYPETGRTHQLRVHFAATGHPVAGDTSYGPTKRPLGLKRHFLHATKLELTASSGKRLLLESSLPDDLLLVLNSIEDHYT